MDRVDFDPVLGRLPKEKQRKIPPFLIEDVDLKGKLNITKQLADLVRSYKQFKKEKDKREEAEEELEEAAKEFKLKLVDITNFLNSYNLFMFMSISSYNQIVETLKQHGLIDLDYIEYKQIDPKYRLFQDNDNLKKFKDSMENNVNKIYDKLLFFMQPFGVEKFDINS